MIKQSQRGIALGPILFVISLLGVISSVLAIGGGVFNSTSRTDQAEVQLVGQANLIRAKITECYVSSLGSSKPSYPVSAAGQDTAVTAIPSTQAAATTSLGQASCLAGAGQSANACYYVSTVSCPYSDTLLFGATTGNLLPPPPLGMRPWVFARDGMNIRITTAPAANSPDPALQDAIRRARSKFSGPSTANGAVQGHHETDADETTWAFTVWVRR